MTATVIQFHNLGKRVFMKRQCIFVGEKMENFFKNMAFFNPPERLFLPYTMSILGVVFPEI
jgi:hypothetical protein